jgi:DNA-dependent RNA polymerase auxiliary subunit epsilon
VITTGLVFPIAQIPENVEDRNYQLHFEKRLKSFILQYEKAKNFFDNEKCSLKDNRFS